MHKTTGLTKAAADALKASARPLIAQMNEAENQAREQPGGSFLGIGKAFMRATGIIPNKKLIDNTIDQAVSAVNATLPPGLATPLAGLLKENKKLIVAVLTATKGGRQKKINALIDTLMKKLEEMGLSQEQMLQMVEAAKQMMAGLKIPMPESTIISQMSPEDVSKKSDGELSLSEARSFMEMANQMSDPTKNYPQRMERLFEQAASGDSENLQQAVAHAGQQLMQGASPEDAARLQSFVEQHAPGVTKGAHQAIDAGAKVASTAASVALQNKDVRKAIQAGKRDPNVKEGFKQFKKALPKQYQKDAQQLWNAAGNKRKTKQQIKKYEKRAHKHVDAMSQEGTAQLTALTQQASQMKGEKIKSENKAATQTTGESMLTQASKSIDGRQSSSTAPTKSPSVSATTAPTATRSTGDGPSKLERFGSFLKSAASAFAKGAKEVSKTVGMFRPRVK